LLTNNDALKLENNALNLENKALQHNSSCYQATQINKLKQQYKEIEIKTVALKQSNDHFKAESAVLAAVIDQLNEQLSEKYKPIGDMANFSRLKTP
jgi:peptidoglycan hydrolase CwlO-like protein